MKKEQVEESKSAAEPFVVRRRFADLAVCYDNDRMLPRSVHVKNENGEYVPFRRVVIEIVPNALPRVIELQNE